MKLKDIKLPFLNPLRVQCITTITARLYDSEGCLIKSIEGIEFSVDSEEEAHKEIHKLLNAGYCVFVTNAYRPL